jgi:hypothetical protein
METSSQRATNRSLTVAIARLLSRATTRPTFESTCLKITYVETTMVSKWKQQRTRKSIYSINDDKLLIK